MRSRSFRLWFAALSLTAVTGGAGRSLAVGTSFTFQGQLLDGSVPRNGACDFQFKLFDAAIDGNQIGLAETLLSIAVQNGVFTVQLNAAGQFGPTAFGGGDRWLEIAVRCPAGDGSFGAPFNPRQAITAVPYALHVSSGLTGLVDNGDGTVTDHSTGLMWEKKTGTIDTPVNCSTVACPDPRNVNNRYTWCDDDSPADFDCDNDGPYNQNPPDGTAFFDFLARTNGMLCDNFNASNCPGLAGYTDWRIPTTGELITIKGACQTESGPCIDPIFGPTASEFYWSSTTSSESPANAITLNFGSFGFVGGSIKWNVQPVRAVRRVHDR